MQDKVSPYQQFLSLQAQRIEGKEIARILKVSPSTISRWKFHGPPKNEGAPKRIDYRPIDKMIKQGITIKKICKECHCGESTVVKRRLFLRSGLKKDIPYVPVNHLDRPFMPLKDRYERKRRNLHLSKSQFAVWISGVAGKQFMANQPQLGGAA